MGTNDDYFIFKLNPDNKSYSIRINTQQEFPVDLIIPDRFNELPVSIIAKNAFLNSASLSTVFIPNTIEIIDNYAFSNCNSLKRIDFENNSCLKSIGRYSFAKCTRLQSIVLQNKLENIFEYAFKDCVNLQHVYLLSKRIKNICPSAFYNASKYLTIFMKRKYLSCNHSSVFSLNNVLHLPKIIPNDLSYFKFSLNDDKLSYSISAVNHKDLPINLILPDLYNLLPITAVEKDGFSTDISLYNQPYIKMLILNKNLKTVHARVFMGQRLIEELFIPKNIERIEDSSFHLSGFLINDNPFYLISKSELNSIIFERGSKLTYLGNGALSFNNKITAIELPPDVSYIGTVALGGLNIEELNIPSKVSYIGENITFMCTNLKRITVDIRNKNYKSLDNMLYKFDESELLAIPLANQNSIISINKNVKKMSFYNPFYGNQIIQAIFSLPVIPPTEIKRLFFDLDKAKCRSIKIYVPDESVDLYKQTSPWMDFAENIYPLSIVTDSNLAVENNMLIQCLDNSSTISLPDNINAIQNFAFEGCSNLENILVSPENENFSSIDGVLFNKDCSELICYPQNKADYSYTIPPSVETIGYSAFMFAGNLASINFFKGLKAISDYSFYYCTSLMQVNNLDLNDNIESVGAYSFFYCYSIKNLKFHSLLKVGSYAFDICYNASLSFLPTCNNPITINLGPKISIISQSTFSYNFDNLVIIIEAVIPPQMGQSFIPAKIILVPNTSIDAYKNTLPFHYDLLKPIEGALIY